MTNKDKYKKAFSTLHASDNISLEVEIMEKNRHLYRMKKVVAACAAVAVVFGGMTVAYAADLGGFRKVITSWFHGEQAQWNVTENETGSYSYTYTDENGEMHEGSGGGVAIDEDGSEIPLSAEEVMENVGNEVETDEDGNIWFYYYDKKFNITDLFDENDVCKAAFEYEGKTVYFVVGGLKGETAVPGSYSLEYGMEVPQDVENYTMIR